MREKEADRGYIPECRAKKKEPREFPIAGYLTSRRCIERSPAVGLKIKVMYKPRESEIVKKWSADAVLGISSSHIITSVWSMDIYPIYDGGKRDIVRCV